MSYPAADYEINRHVNTILSTVGQPHAAHAAGGYWAVPCPWKDKHRQYNIF